MNSAVYFMIIAIDARELEKGICIFRSDCQAVLPRDIECMLIGLYDLIQLVLIFIQVCFFDGRHEIDHGREDFISDVVEAWGIWFVWGILCIWRGNFGRLLCRSVCLLR